MTQYNVWMNTENLQIIPLSALKDNYIWTIIDNRTRHTIIVDPGETAPVQHFLTEHDLILKGILITHHHWDHTNGVTELLAANSVPVAAPAKENVAGKSIAAQSGITISFPDFPLSFQVMDIPGHTKGHVAYVGNGMVFCGDTLFAAGCGRLFEGTAAQMYHSLTQLASLPESSMIYCAHEYTLNNLRFAATVEPNNEAIVERIQRVHALRAQGLPTLPSTLAIEKATNPFLRCQEATVIQQAEKYAERTLAGPVDVFTTLREWKDQF